MHQTGSNKHTVEPGKVRRRMWVVGILLLALGALTWELIYHDDPPPDDADLVPHWSERGGDANPLAVLCSTLGSSPIRDYERLPHAVTACEPGQEAAIERYLATQSLALDAFRAIVQTDRTRWQWPEREAMTVTHYASTNARACTQLAGTLELKVHVLRSGGQADAAARLCLELAAFGDGLMHAEGDCIHLLTGRFILNQAEEQLLSCLSRMDAKNAPFLRHCLRELALIEGPARTDVQFVLRVDHQSLARRIDPAEMNALHQDRWEAHGLALTIKRQRTLGLHQKQVSPTLEGLKSTWREGLLAEREAAQVRQQLKPSQAGWRFYFDTNVVGRLILSMEGGYRDVIEAMMETVVLHRQTRLHLALRLHELEKGSLPVHLEDLVPAYLPEVPVDEFSGNSMRWDVTRKMLYSMGRNMKDDGGSVEPARRKQAKDLGFAYAWSNVPAPLKE